MNKNGTEKVVLREVVIRLKERERKKESDAVQARLELIKEEGPRCTRKVCIVRTMRKGRRKGSKWCNDEIYKKGIMRSGLIKWRCTNEHKGYKKEKRRRSEGKIKVKRKIKATEKSAGGIVA